MDWNIARLQETLGTGLFGGHLHFYPEIVSTNDEAIALAMAGAPEGTAVLADAQTAGRGRWQRSWISPPGVNIYTTIVLRPECESSGASQIPIMAGVAAAEVLDGVCPGRVKLKWPNDVIIGPKKVCGILSQAKITSKKIDFAVVGIGINVNAGLHHFPKTIRESATSLLIESGGEISRHDLLISLYENFGKWYKQLLQKGFEPIRKKWLESAAMIGRPIRIAFKGENTEGIAKGLGDDGCLILVAEGNEEIKVSAGDATIMMWKDNAFGD